MNEKISKENQIKIDRMKRNLRTLRKLAGWTAEDLGEKLGVYKQTICNLEGENSTMSLMQYIAIRSVLETEAATHKEKEALAKAIPLLLDDVHEVSEHKRKLVEQKVNQVAKTASSGIDQETLTTLFTVMLSTIGVVASLVAANNTKWISELLNNVKKK